MLRIRIFSLSPAFPLDRVRSPLRSSLEVAPFLSFLAASLALCRREVIYWIDLTGLVFSTSFSSFSSPPYPPSRLGHYSVQNDGLPTMLTKSVTLLMRF